MSTLLDAATLAALTNHSAYADSSQYPSAQMTAVLGAVQQQCARFLGYEPTLLQHSNEDGPVQWLASGPYAGRYLLTLRHRPLVPGDATAVFTDLALTYALSLTLPATVNLPFTVVEHSTGRVYALAPGFVDALSGVGFGYGGSQQAIWAVGYRASYVGGWATGLADPTPPGGGSYGADHIPSDVQYAAALLAQEALTVQAAQNADTTRPYAGILTSVRVGERAETYRPLAPSTAERGSNQNQAPLGYGGPLAQQAAALLARYKKTPIAHLV